ncbi:MAG TPA: hypothetical protein VGD45_20290 [Steroidobacter sp.]|uniref:hypothetical protein n=1 Tax=Steroidobacter sp. TaxID=1978227 RepID=UPI002EDA7CE7
MANTIDELRKHLFETLEGLKDKDKPLDIERAKAVCEVAGQIIDTAKVEVAYLNVVGGQGSGFIPQGQLPGAKPLQGDSNRTNGAKRITHQ